MLKHEQSEHEHKAYCRLAEGQRLVVCVHVRRASGGVSVTVIAPRRALSLR
jgi:hypothetical protein